MKKDKTNYLYGAILLILLVGVLYTACKDITPEQTRVETNIELKLSK